MSQAFKESIEAVCHARYGIELNKASRLQLYHVLSEAVKSRLQQIYRESVEATVSKGQKKVYYLSMEFLVGRSLKNALYQLGLIDEAEELLSKLGTNLSEISEKEPDPGLGNGGLGRLAACYLDAASTKGIPFQGYSIKYEFGIFRQRIVDGWQMEFPDEWLDNGEVWLRARKEDAVEVTFGGRVEEHYDGNGYRPKIRDARSVVALPYDLFVPGYSGHFCNVLTVWEAKSKSSFDMAAFSRGEYAKALEDQNMAEVISKVLYPADDHIEGKRLRLQQQYLLVSASVQSIVREHLARHGGITELSRFAVIHLNDTHPALAIPELMRILMDEHHLGWEQAWQITRDTITYTNHTVMSEAMECWDLTLYETLLPRIGMITREIDRRTRLEHLAFYGNDRPKLEYMAIISGGEVRMVNLCLACARKVNGVSSLHTQILSDSYFHDYAVMEPGKLVSVTNGIAYRRWLCQANPLLTNWIEELIGDQFRFDASYLSKLNDYREDDSALDRLWQIKHENKVLLSHLIASRTERAADPSSLFDVQIKRLHEYKRQLLCAFRILSKYLDIKNGIDRDPLPTTYLFAAKASPGYRMAKQIIRLIIACSRMIDSDPAVRDVMRVVFLEDYNVSLAERIIPAAELSEQISLAGKEASGTGNMKLMMNGALTVGTYDGANVEIFDRVGEDNGFLFGLRREQVEQLKRVGYRPSEYPDRSPRLRAVLNLLSSGFGGCRFDEILTSLLHSHRGQADPYMILADFDDYLQARERADEVYRNRRCFSSMSLKNIAESGFFSADRAVAQYAEQIWGIYS